MKSRLLKLAEKIRTSLWFVPGGLLLVGLGLALLCLAIDLHGRETLAAILPSYGPSNPAGARAFLTTIAGGVLGIVGVSFSITIVTLTLASSQFGPRLIRNFMRSTTTQMVLGGLLGTFVYAMIVLANLPGEASPADLPRLSILVAMVLTLISLGLFIYFLHHIALSLQSDRVVADVFADVESMLARLFPDDVHESDRFESDECEPVPENPAATLAAPRDGYLQAIDVPSLSGTASRENLVVHVHHHPDAFVLQGAPFAAVTGRGAAEFSEDTRGALEAAFLIGDQPTATQDFEFSIRQLVEIGLRALSPGINDPFTAINCIDYLGATVAQMAHCGLPRSRVHDSDGNLRVVLKVTTFDGVVGAAFDQLRQAADGRCDVSLHLLDVFDALIRRTERHEYREVLVQHAIEILNMLERHDHPQRDAAAIAQRSERLRELGAPVADAQ